MTNFSFEREISLMSRRLLITIIIVIVVISEMKRRDYICETLKWRTFSRGRETCRDTLRRKGFRFLSVDDDVPEIRW
ncbi:hypothetical protein PUN28_007661 [Cardiocondyla obscurior]|uniref:Uncharacterized protein n=1 Tax=Cardiocondyla obscurior TaxID=286306 RepID=A0AAW2G8A2_9HYME